MRRGWRNVTQELEFETSGQAAHSARVKAELKVSDIFSQNAEVMSGALVFKGTRIPVHTFFEHLDRTGTIEQFLEWYDGVTREQLEAAEEIGVPAGM
jgi:uncharacterized protein (DUF433 family)